MVAVAATRATSEFFLRRFDGGFVEAFIGLGLFLDRNRCWLRHR